MNILIMGAGAVGSAFGGFLRKSGHDVTLIGRSDHMNAITQNGLRISGIWGDHCVDGFQCLEQASDAKGPYDTVLICVKSFDSAAAAQAIKPHLSDNTLLVSLQNGVGNVEQILGASKHPWTLGGRVIFGIVRPAPGEIDITVYTQPVMIGFPTAQLANARPDILERAQSFADAIAAADIPCEYTPDIEQHLWAKLLYNCALNPLSSLHRVHYGALPERAEWRSCMDGIIDEIFAVAAGRGVELMWSDPDAFRVLFYDKLVPDTYHHHSSMLQDIEKGNRTEIDALCGMVVEYAREQGLAVPENEAMLKRIQELSS
jgi:2-dehydropantoate 2-reductase